MADPIFVDLLAALDIVIMERLQDRSFRVLGTIPDWFVPIHTAASGGDTPELERAFPFLDHFLEEAAAFWRQPNNEGSLRSGPYSAKDGYGVEFHFEVSTVLAERRIFLLFHLLRDFDETRHVYQRARERTLELQKVGLKRAALLSKAKTLGQHVEALMASATPEQAAVAEKIRRTSDEIAAGIEALPSQP